MQYIQPTPGNVPPIEDLLTRVEAASVDDLSPNPTDAQVPTLREFLDEEDVLRECRMDNTRLVNYLCRHDIILELVAATFELPPVASPARPNGSGSATTATSTDSPPANHEQEKERNLKYAHIASELLTCDNKRIGQVIVSDPAVMTKVFSYLRGTPPGQLHNLVAVYFSKLIVSLLKIHNALTIEQLSRCDPPFIDTLLMHIDSLPIADLIVRILDAPDPDLTGAHHGNKLPSQEAIQFLISANLLNGLAECFVRASAETLYTPLENVKPPSDDNAQIADEEEDYEMHARRRRLREETMCNVTTTVLALTERILQFPELDLAVPDAISPYASPELMSRLIDAGLYASCNPPSIGDDGAKRATPNLGETHDERVAAFSTGNNSALLHSLGLAADLMTAQCNIYRDEVEDDRVPVDFHTGGQAGPTYTGNGIGPSVTGGDGTDNAHANGPSGNDEHGEGGANVKLVPGPLKGKKAGDPIVSTEALATELAVRFSRLSEMFGEVEDIAAAPQRRPLGSLRLKLAEFFVACMRTGSQETVNQVTQLKVPQKLLELFGRYQWSSMLHGVVTDAVVSSLTPEESCRWARTAWLDAGLINWLIESWRKSDDNSLPIRAGYMGHLIRIGTAFKAFLEEGEQELDRSEMPSQREIDSFDIFAEEVLVPAHTRELTPLCDGDASGQGEGDEGEDATDVLDMTGIQFGTLTEKDVVVGANLLKNAGVVKTDDIEDEGEIRPVETYDDEIKTVEVDDLDHFGGDTPRPDGSNKMVDHDVPAELRQQLNSEPNVVAVKPLEDGEAEEKGGQSASSSTRSVSMSASALATLASGSAPESESAMASMVAAAAAATTTTTTSTATKKVAAAEATGGAVKSESEKRKGGESGVSDDLSGVIDNVDSSSEDEGTYVSFMDEQRERESKAKLEAAMGRMRISEEGPSASLDAAVTEIDEPAPIMNEVVQLGEDDSDNSSEDGYEAWEDPSREGSAADSDVAASSSSVSSSPASVSASPTSVPAPGTEATAAAEVAAEVAAEAVAEAVSGVEALSGAEQSLLEPSLLEPSLLEPSKASPQARKEEVAEEVDKEGVVKEVER